MKKKLAIALLIAFVSGIVMTSCRSNKTCPAYGESQKYIQETRYYYRCWERGPSTPSTGSGTEGSGTCDTIP